MVGWTSDDFSVLVLASDLGIDARPFLEKSENEAEEEEGHAKWHDCPSYLSDEDFSDLDVLGFASFQGSDKMGNRILRLVGKLFPARVVSGERLKKYVVHKMKSATPEGPFCIVYMHSDVRKEDNSPGMSVLRWIYEEGLPLEIKERLRIVYFIHPGLRSRLLLATLGRLFLTSGLYWKIRYVSRLQYLYEDICRGEIEIPQFVKDHDNVLEHRPLTDYGIEPDIFRITELPPTSYSFPKYQDRLTAFSS